MDEERCKNPLPSQIDCDPCDRDSLPVSTKGVTGGGHVYVRQEPQHLVIHKPAYDAKMKAYEADRQTLVDHWAACKIQSVFRGLKARKNAKKKGVQVRAALKAQRFVRGMLGRKRFKKLRFKRTIAALNLQRVWRGRVGRKKYLAQYNEYTQAVMQLQAVFRGFVGRKKWKRHHELMSMVALRIQALRTGKLIRIEVAKRRNAVLEIQAWARMVLAKRRVAEKRIIMTNAARIIQRNSRSFLVRTWVKRYRIKRYEMTIWLQRHWRGHEGRKKAAHERWLRDTAAATQIERIVRGHLGRKYAKWVYVSLMALRVQKGYRGRMGRRKARGVKMERLRILMHARNKMKNHYVRTQERKRGAIEIQRLYRGAEGRRRYWYFIRVKKAIRLQAWMRKIWSIRKLRLFARAMICMQGCVRAMRPRLLRIRRHLGLRDKANHMAREGLNEMQKVLLMDEFFTDPKSHPHEQRYELAVLLLQNKATLRRLYLKYSLFMVSDPDKAFQMSPTQWARLIKDAGMLGKDLNALTVEDAFNTSKKPLPKETGRFEKVAKPDMQVLFPEEFIEALLRLSNHMLGATVGGSIGFRFELMLKKYWTPAFAIKDTDYSEPETPGLDEEGSEVHTCIKNNTDILKKCFNFFSGGDDSIDCPEFMKMAQKTDVINASTSLNKVMDAFVRCNQDELTDYFLACPNPQEIREMDLEFEEFLTAVTAIAYIQPPKKKGDPFVDRLEAFIQAKFAVHAANQFVNCK